MGNRALRWIGVSGVLILLAFAGASVGWHDHAFWVDELAPRLVAQVDHVGTPDGGAHFDAGASELRATCWACLLSSSPLVPTAGASAPHAAPAADAPVADRLLSLVDGRGRAPAPARGPPSALSILSA